MFVPPSNPTEITDDVDDIAWSKVNGHESSSLTKKQVPQPNPSKNSTHKDLVNESTNTDSNESVIPSSEYLGDSYTSEAESQG